MADLKISQLSDGGDSQATDEYVIARSGANYRIDGASIAAAATKVGTLSSLTVSGATNLATTSAATKIGLGTTSPDASFKVTISGNSGTTTPGIYFDDQASSPKNYVLYTNGSKNFVLGNNTDSINVFEATPAGNLGLGVTPDAGAKMTVAGGILATAAFSATTGSTAGFDYSGGSMRFFSMGTSGSTKGAYSWIAKGADNSSSTPMTLDASGNLGVGTASPLNISGFTTIEAKGSTAGLIGVSSGSGTSFGRMYNGGSSMIFGTSTNHPLIFDTNDTERARITSGGDFLINKTTSNGKLTVWGDGTSSAANAIGIFNSGGANVFVGRNDGLINTGATTESPYNHIVGGTNRDLYVDNGGDLGYVSSVRASKMNIAPVTDVNWLLDLNPVTFNFRKRDEDGQYTDEVDGPLNHGLIAEEVEAVNADLCFYDNEEMGGALRGVNYSHLITPMLKLIQTQQSRIEALEARLEALET